MDLKRYQTLAEQNSIAKQQAEDQVFIVQQYQGSVKQDQGLVDAQALNIAYCNIVSPVTGRIGLRLIDPGNYVQSDSATGLAVVTQLQPITVIFSIPEDDLPDVMPQMNSGTKLAGHGIRPRQRQTARRGQCHRRGQSNRYDHRHREGARAV